MGESESVLASGNRTPHQPVLTGPVNRRKDDGGRAPAPAVVVFKIALHTMRGLGFF